MVPHEALVRAKCFAQNRCGGYYPRGAEPDVAQERCACGQIRVVARHVRDRVPCIASVWRRLNTGGSVVIRDRQWFRVSSRARTA